MEATGFKSQGSFGVPEAMQRQLDEARKKGQVPNPEGKARPPVSGQPVSPEQVEAVAAMVEKEEKKQAPEDKDTTPADVQAAIDYWKKQLEIEITPDDLVSYIFQGQIVKDGIMIASFTDPKDKTKNKDFRVTFQSQTPADVSDIDERMAEFRDKGRYTADGLENEKALQILARGLLKADGRSIGKTPDERYANIRRLGAHTVDLITNAWRGFNILLRISMQEKTFLKK
jgi:hypothetical protein